MCLSLPLFLLQHLVWHRTPNFERLILVDAVTRSLSFEFRMKKLQIVENVPVLATTSISNLQRSSSNFRSIDRDR